MVKLVGLIMIVLGLIALCIDKYVSLGLLVFGLIVTWRAEK